MKKILSLTLLFVLVLSVVPLTDIEYGAQAQETHNYLVISLHENINIKQASDESPHQLFITLKENILLVTDAIYDDIIFVKYQSDMLANMDRILISDKNKFSLKQKTNSLLMNDNNFGSVDNLNNFYINPLSENVFDNINNFNIVNLISINNVENNNLL